MSLRPTHRIIRSHLCLIMAVHCSSHCNPLVLLPIGDTKKTNHLIYVNKSYFLKRKCAKYLCISKKNHYLCSVKFKKLNSMAKILGIKTLKLRTKFEIVKVQMDCADPYTDVDFQYVESMVDTHSAYTGFRYITGVFYPSDDTYCTYWLCSLRPRCSISDKDIKMFKDIINFSQL